MADQTAITFGDQNQGFQVGLNYGTINNDLHLPQGKSCKSPAITYAKIIEQNNQNLRRNHTLQFPSAAILTSSNAIHSSNDYLMLSQTNIPVLRSWAWAG